MPKKLSLYKSVKTGRGWRYCKAAFHSNAKVKPNIVLVDGVEEKHAEGAYFTSATISGLRSVMMLLTRSAS